MAPLPATLLQPNCPFHHCHYPRCKAHMTEWQNSICPSRPKWNLISMIRSIAFYDAFSEVPSWVLGQASPIWKTQSPSSEGFAAQWEADGNMHRHRHVGCAGTGHWVAPIGRLPRVPAPAAPPVGPSCLLPICGTLASQGQRLGLLFLAHSVFDTRCLGKVWLINK